MILLVDNYDSFTYNLYQYAGSTRPDIRPDVQSEIRVVRNDKISVEEIEDLKPSHIIISPGPGFPAQAGISIKVIKKFFKSIPILGVCLGHQSIGEAFGGNIIHAQKLFHGKSSEIYLSKNKLFSGLPEKIKGARYHSLIIEKESLPNELEIIASTQDGEIMGIKHRKYPMFGIQFHPESILTECGLKIIENFLKIRV